MKNSNEQPANSKISSGIYIHEIKLPETNDFSKKFNYVSWLWQKSFDKTLSEEKREFYTNEHWSAKYNLEQDLPMSFLNEYEK